MINRKITAVLSGIILLAYMGLIMYLSSIPGSEIHVTTPDYILHGLAFGGLSFLMTIFLLHYLNLKQSIIFSLLLTFLFALSDEAHQYFVPGRVPDWRDIWADMIGALLVQIGLVILLRLFSYVKSRARQHQ